MNDTTILAVDDKPTILANMNLILGALYRMRVANSGLRALQIVQTDPAGRSKKPRYDLLKKNLKLKTLFNGDCSGKFDDSPFFI